MPKKGARGDLRGMGIWPTNIVGRFALCGGGGDAYETREIVTRRGHWVGNSDVGAGRYAKTSRPGRDGQWNTRQAGWPGSDCSRQTGEWRGQGDHAADG